MTARSLDEAIQESHAALGAISNGDVEPYMALYSDSENVTLGNPFGPFVRGKEAVRGAGERAASRYRDGQVAGFERVATHVADGLACVAGAGYRNATDQLTRSEIAAAAEFLECRAWLGSLR
jgi:ketosteroid isomerase-like protein